MQPKNLKAQLPKIHKGKRGKGPRACGERGGRRAGDSSHPSTTGSQLGSESDRPREGSRRGGLGVGVEEG
eukprot:1170665-Rhodomonas_salina.1